MQKEAEAAAKAKAEADKEAEAAGLHTDEKAPSISDLLADTQKARQEVIKKAILSK